jgi:ferredoxin
LVCALPCGASDLSIFHRLDKPASRGQNWAARKWPSITKSKAPLAEADSWKDTKDKLEYLER